MRILTLLFALCLCLVLGFFILGGDDEGLLPGQDANVTAPADTVSIGARQVGHVTQREAERQSVTAAGAAALGTNLTSLLLKGRVVDSNGNGIAAAEIALFVAESLFTTSGRFDGGDRGQRGGRSQRGERGRPGRDGFAELRKAIANRQKLEAVTALTDVEGRFAFHKPAFKTSTLELTVTHQNFAPKVVRERWTKAAGDIELEDIVLPLGGTIIGVVVDQNEAPIGGADVHFIPSSDRSRGRGRRGGSGRNRGGSDRLAELIDAVQTDAAGNFELRHVPPGRLEVSADADRFLPATSGSIRLDENEIVKDTVIHLRMGTPLSGRVTDLASRPIEGAVVVVAVSREAERQRAEAAREEARARKQAGETVESKQAAREERRGGRERGGDRSQKLEMVTNAEGRFAFDAVPFEGVTIDVKHENYISEHRDPVYAEESAVVEILLQDRITARGIVVNAVTGQPIEIYGIAARKIETRDEGGWGFGRRGEQDGRGRSRGGNRGGDSETNRRLDRFREMTQQNPEVAARIAEYETRRQTAAAQKTERDAYWQNLLGESGMVAGKTPPASRHERGEFVIEDLLPGRYVFDIESPDHVRIAAGIIELRAGVPLPSLLFRLEPGRDIAGRVVDSGKQTPIEKARVELYFPDLAVTPQGDRSLRDLFRRGEKLGKRIAEARTDVDGKFELHPQKPGRYVLRIQAQDYLAFVETDFIVTLEDRLDDLLLSLDTGARVYGRIVDLEQGRSATVELTHTDGKTYSGAVHRETGIYTIQGLPAGGYFVKVDAGRDRSRRGRGGRGDRDRGSSLTTRIAAEQGRQPHLYLTKNQELRHDTTIAPTDLGKVHGFVLLNGEPASGYEVQLKPRADNTGDQREGVINRIISRLFSAQTDREGRFEIQGILPGSYLMAVQGRSSRGRSGRGGRSGRSGSQGALHVEPVEVVAGLTVEPTIRIEVGSLKVELVDSEGVAASGAQLSIVRAGEVDASDPKSWRKAPSYQRLDTRGGVVESGDIGTGTYLFSVSGRSIKSQTGELQVLAGTTAVTTITVEKQTDQDIMRSLDKDGDGALSVEELPGRLKEQFAAADTDKDGKISVDEFSAARAAMQTQRRTEKRSGKQVEPKQKRR